MSLLDSAGVVTGDIWCNGAFSFESPLKDLLDSGVYTLEQLLQEDELLQELRGMHPQLIDYLSSEESVTGLIQYIIQPPYHHQQQQQQEQPALTTSSPTTLSISSGNEHTTTTLSDPEEINVVVENATPASEVGTQPPKQISDVEEEKEGEEVHPSSIILDDVDHPQSNHRPLEHRVRTQDLADPGAEQPVHNYNNNVNNNSNSNKEPGKWLLGGNSQPDEENHHHLLTQHDHHHRTEQQQQQPQQGGDNNEALYVRYPYMACEVLCCEIKGIIDILVDGYVPASSMRGGIKKINDNFVGHNSDRMVEDTLDKTTEMVPTTTTPTLTTLLPTTLNGDMKLEESNNNNQLTTMATTTTAATNTTDPRGRPILDLLFSMLYDSSPGEIDDYRAGYFDKILSVLFRKRPQAMSQYINYSDGGRGTNVSLISAMFKHLYSHSIMQIVQRLLLPHPPVPTKQDSGVDKDDDGEELFNGTLLEGTDMDGMGSFRCNWSESEVSLEILLDCLIGNNMAAEIERDEERKLSLYQNASEVLITIIQNSPLTSPTLHLLTTDPVMERLILAATTIEEGTTFSNHDSRLTCAMNVLESLILQLGGYGSVGTMIYPDDEEEENGGQTSGDIVSGPDSERVDSEQASTRNETNTADPVHPYCATCETLIQHLPNMLSSLEGLLRYSGAEYWVSQMQFSKTQPQKILGSSRLRIARLLESLVLLGDANVDLHLCESRCLEICLDLFWKFQWCSMLHQSVANLLVHVFEGQNARAELQSYFLVRCNLLGRLMDSFWDGTEDVASATSVTNENQTEGIVGVKDDSDPSTTMSSVTKEKGNTDDVLPVSDDDVDAAMEQQEAASNNTPLGIRAPTTPHGIDASRIVGLPDHTAPQSFRLGYMGHVIIICQALVHACSNDGKSEAPSIAGCGISGEENGELDQFVRNLNEEEQSPGGQQSLSLVDALERGRAGESVGTEETPSGTLILAHLVDSHPLCKQWQLFVSTTLASETAIQSTPLGGFHGSSQGMDPLHSHRPGLADDGGYDDDDGAAPTLPPRGLLVGGDVIDMDDNDLDVAASMMAGLSLGRSVEMGVRSDQDMLAGIPSQSSGPSRGGYIFDDPLGDGRFGQFDDDDDDSSSDEESELSGNTGGSGGAMSDGIHDNSTENDAPVMDLFAGNFDGFGDKDPGSQESAGWSDFANFDDAFGGEQTSDENPADDPQSNFDSVFGDVKDHAILLEELDNPPHPESGKLGLEGRVLDEDPIAIDEVETVTEQAKAAAS